MSLTTTTLASALSASATSMSVTSATGFSAGMFARIDGETVRVQNSYVSGTSIPILRGQDGTVTADHKVSANITVGLATDFATPTPGGPTSMYPTQRGRVLTSYSASGAIGFTPGTDTVAVINGTSALAMTLAQPTKDQDGDRMTIIGNGKSTSTVTLPSASGIGNAGSSYDVLTFQGAGQVAIELMAMNGVWVLLSAPLTGTSTALSIAIA